MPSGFGTEPSAGEKEETMLGWAVVFLVIAIVAGLLGFAGIAGTAAWIAKVLFVVFLVLFLLGIVMHFGRGGRSSF